MLLIDKGPLFFGRPQRGDAVLFHSVEASGRPLVKRVVGTPGDTLVLRDDVLYLNSVALPGPAGDVYAAEVVVPPAHYWLMGDNRVGSRDSRQWGPIPEENIAGKARIVLWPPGDIGFVR